MCKQISFLKKQGKQVIVVSSGAVGLGEKVLNKIDGLGVKQAKASIGQIKLMNIYSKYFSKVGLSVAQFLLTSDDFRNKIHLSNLIKTYNNLPENVIPIVNENDVVFTEELTFGDNDVLATEILINLDFDVLLVLTKRGALISKNKIIRFSNKYSVEDYDSIGKNFGFGGLESKLVCAKKSVQAGKIFIITKIQENILDVLNLKGNFTFFR